MSMQSVGLGGVQEALTPILHSPHALGIWTIGPSLVVSLSNDIANFFNAQLEPLPIVREAVQALWDAEGDGAWHSAVSKAHAAGYMAQDYVARIEAIGSKIGTLVSIGAVHTLLVAGVPMALMLPGPLALVGYAATVSGSVMIGFGSYGLVTTLASNFLLGLPALSTRYERARVFTDYLKAHIRVQEHRIWSAQKPLVDYIGPRSPNVAPRLHQHITDPIQMIQFTQQADAFVSDLEEMYAQSAVSHWMSSSQAWKPGEFSGKFDVAMIEAETARRQEKDGIVHTLSIDAVDLTHKVGRITYRVCQKLIVSASAIAGDPLNAATVVRHALAQLKEDAISMIKDVSIAVGALLVLYHVLRAILRFILTFLRFLSKKLKAAMWVRKGRSGHLHTAIEDARSEAIRIMNRTDKARTSSATVIDIGMGDDEEQTLFSKNRADMEDRTVLRAALVEARGESKLKMLNKGNYVEDGVGYCAESLNAALPAEYIACSLIECLLDNLVPKATPADAIKKQIEDEQSLFGVMLSSIFNHKLVEDFELDEEPPSKNQNESFVVIREFYKRPSRNCRAVALALLVCAMA
jgi:hypothetical protein